MSNDNPQQQTAISADFPFAVRHVQVHGARMAYVDEGSGDPIVFLHGNPTSSYLWRNVIPRVRGLAFMEAILGPVPSWEEFPPQGREIFQKLRTPGVGEPMVLDHNMFVEQLLPGSVVRSLSPAEMQHYRAPFVERAARKPMLAWPREIPIAGEPADVVAVVSRYRDALCQSQLPKLLFTVEPGMLVPAPLVAWCRASLPKLDVIALGRGLHFVQEDHPHAIGEHLAAWVRRTRAG